MTDIATEIEIAAPPARVWSVLADTASYGDWNPFIRAIAGEWRAGAKVSVLLGPPGQRAMRFTPILLAVDEAKELRWRGSLGVSGIFDGEHAFVLEPAAGGRTRFVQSERFSGLLAGLIMRGSMLDATRQGFAAMNEALKKRAESASSAGESRL
jgi:hypothetical protein